MGTTLKVANLRLRERIIGRGKFYWIYISSTLLARTLQLYTIDLEEIGTYPLSKGVHKSEIVPPLFVNALAAKTPIDVKGSYYTSSARMMLPDYESVA